MPCTEAVRAKLGETFQDAFHRFRTPLPVANIWASASHHGFLTGWWAVTSWRLIWFALDESGNGIFDFTHPPPTPTLTFGVSNRRFLHLFPQERPDRNKGYDICSDRDSSNEKKQHSIASTSCSISAQRGHHRCCAMSDNSGDVCLLPTSRVDSCSWQSLGESLHIRRWAIAGGATRRSGIRGVLCVCASQIGSLPDRQSKFDAVSSAGHLAASLSAFALHGWKQLFRVLRCLWTHDVSWFWTPDCYTCEFLLRCAAVCILSVCAVRFFITVGHAFFVDSEWEV